MNDNTNNQVREIAEATGLPEDRVLTYLRALQASYEQVADLAGPITYTNRAARRARARAERKN